MVLFPDLLFWLYLALFLFIVIIVFYVPAAVLLSNVKINIVQKLTLGTCLGIALWGLQGYIFGYFNMRWASYLYIIFFLLLWFKFFRFRFIFKFKSKLQSINIKKIDVIIAFIIILGSLIQLSSVWFAGIRSANGILFNAYSLGDNLWYMDLTSQLVKSVPPSEPGFSGIVIQNYHYWSSLIMGEIIRVFHFPFIPTVSQYFPILFSILLAGTLISFCQILRLPKIYLLWLSFFVYFGADFVLPLQIFSGKHLDFTQQSMEDGAKFFSNPPRAFAIVLLFSALNYLCLWLKDRKKILGIIISIIFGVIIGFKIYVGFFGLAGLFILNIFLFIKKDFSLIIYTLLAVVISLFIYLPVNSMAGGILYTGFWRSRDFIIHPSLGFSGLELAREIFVQHDNWARALLYDFIFLLLYFIGTFGTKIIGIFQNKITIKKFPKEINVFLLGSCLINLIIGTFFIQKSGGSNAFNFIVNVFIIGSFYAALACYYWLDKFSVVIKSLIILLIVMLTIPRSIYQFSLNIHNLIEGNGNLVSWSIVDSYNSLNKQPEGVVLVQPYLSYMRFLSGKDAFLYNDGVLYSHAINVIERKKIRDNLFKNNNLSDVKNELKRNKIDYIYFTDLPVLNISGNKLGEMIYSDESIKIVKVEY